MATKSTRRGGAAAAARPRPAKSGRGRKPAAPKRGTGTTIPGWLVAAVAVVVLVVGGLVYWATRGDSGAGSSASTARPYVGGDLHTVAALGGKLYVGGHDGAAVSTDGARTWSPLPSLRGADAMGWAISGDRVLVAGHNGLRASSGGDFTAVNLPDGVSDVHALGGSGDTVYAASPQAGLLVSTDGGKTWRPRNVQNGRGFMGSIVVDRADPNRLIAPDMQAGATASRDGGRTWQPLGGPRGAMAVAQNPRDPKNLVAVGMGEAAASRDGGASWQPLEVPAGVSAVTFSEDGATLYAARLAGENAVVATSVDGGKTWR
jgi:hypothetical protein